MAEVEINSSTVSTRKEQLANALSVPLNRECISSVIAHCTKGNLGIVAAADSLEKLLIEKDLIYVEWASPRRVGFDPCNRGEVGGSWHDVHELLDAIMHAGYSDKATSHAMCVEVGAADDEAVYNFNHMLSDGVPLMPVKAGEIRYSSLSCGHTNYGFRAVLAKCQNENPRLSRNKVFCKERIAEADPLFATRVDTGLLWTIVKASVRLDYPEVLHIFQASKNVFGTVQRQSTQIQGLNQMWRMASDMKKCKESADWDHIKKQILQTQPSWGGDLDAMTCFIIGKAGQQEHHFIPRFVAFHRQHVSANKRLSSDLWKALADFPLTWLTYVIGTAAFTGPSLPQDLGLMKFVSSGEVSALAKTVQAANASSVASEQKSQVVTAPEPVKDPTKPGAAVQADLLVKQVHLRLKEAMSMQGEIHEHNKVTKAMTFFQIAIGRWVLKKEQPPERVALCGKMLHLHDFGWQLVEDLKTLIPATPVDIGVLCKGWPPKGLPVQSSEEATCTKTTKKGAEFKQTADIYEMNEQGEVTSAIARLRLRGFEPGTCVGSREQPRTWFDIVSVGKHSVRLLWLVKESKDVAIDPASQSYFTPTSAGEGSSMIFASAPANPSTGDSAESQVSTQNAQTLEPPLLAMQSSAVQGVRPPLHERIMDSLLPGAENGEEVLSPNAAEEVVVLASGDETGSAAQAVTEPTGPGASSSVVARPEEATFFIHDSPTEDSFVDVSVDWLLDKCVVKNKQAIVFRHAAWPAKRLAAKPPEILDRAYILWANGMISSYVDDTWKPKDIVSCVCKPKKNAVVIAPCAALQLVLAPDSLKVNSCAEEFLDEQKFDKRARVRKQPCGYPDVLFFLTPLTSDEHVGAFWFVDTTEDKAKANMVWAVAHHTSTGGVGFTLPDSLASWKLNASINGEKQFQRRSLRRRTG